MSESERLRDAEKSWLAASDEEDFFFESFDEPKRLRRSKTIRGGLSALRFGAYTDFEGKWVEHDRAVWLEMIVSDKPRAGGTLLDKLRIALGRRGLILLGTPTPLKPRDWDPARRFRRSEDDLIVWYMKHEFKIVQSGSQTRVIHSPITSALKTHFSLEWPSVRQTDRG